MIIGFIIIGLWFYLPAHPFSQTVLPEGTPSELTQQPLYLNDGSQMDGLFQHSVEIAGTSDENVLFEYEPQNRQVTINCHEIECFEGVWSFKSGSAIVAEKNITLVGSSSHIQSSWPDSLFGYNHSIYPSFEITLPINEEDIHHIIHITANINIDYAHAIDNETYEISSTTSSRQLNLFIITHDEVKLRNDWLQNTKGPEWGLMLFCCGGWFVANLFIWGFILGRIEKSEEKRSAQSEKHRAKQLLSPNQLKNAPALAETSIGKDTQTLDNSKQATTEQSKEKKEAIRWTDIGLDYLKKEKLQDALCCFNKALKKDPHYPPAIEKRAQVLERIEEIEKGKIEAKKRKITVNSRQARMWVEKGTKFSNNGKYEKALECFEKALENDPNSAEAANNKYYTLLKLNRTEEAKRFFEEQTKHQ